MDNFIFFLHILAWPTAIFCTLVGAITFVIGFNYPGSIEEAVDKLKGVKKTFHPFRYLIPALICWAFIIAF